MSRFKLNIGGLFDKSSTVPFQSGHEALAFEPLFDGIKNLPSGLPATFLNENSAFTISFTARSGNLFIISEARLFIGSAFEVDNVTVKLFNKGIELEAITQSDLLEGSSTTFVPNIYSFTNTTNLVDRVDIICNSGFANSTQTILTEFELYGKNITPDFEFNDSVLSTKAWNSSRYDGRQLKGSKINRFTRGDSSYGLTPVISNYTRNIYIGSRVIGLRDAQEGIESNSDDTTLTPFPGFSYITVDEYITVNSDDSITRRSVRGGRGDEDDLTARKGFYTAWYEDFPIGKGARIKTLDKKLNQNLSPSYPVYNNSGQLQKMLLVTQVDPVPSDTDLLQIDHDSGSFYAASYNTSSFIFDYCSGSGNPNGEDDIGAEFSIFNYLLLSQKFFTGSLIASPSADGLSSK